MRRAASVHYSPAARLREESPSGEFVRTQLARMREEDAALASTRAPAVDESCVVVCRGGFVDKRGEFQTAPFVFADQGAARRAIQMTNARRRVGCQIRPANEAKKGAA